MSSSEIVWHYADEPVEPKAYSTEDYLRVTEEQARALVPEEQRKGKRGFCSMRLEKNLVGFVLSELEI